MAALTAALLAHSHPRLLAAVLAAALPSARHPRRYSGAWRLIGDSAASGRAPVQLRGELLD